MSKLDRLKEEINNFRNLILWSLLIVLATTGWLGSVYYMNDKNRIDILFFAGSIIDIICITAIPVFWTKVLKKTKELEDAK